MIEFKKCTRCKHPQPSDAFSIDNQTKDGRCSRCRSCVAVGAKVKKIQQDMLENPAPFGERIARVLTQELREALPVAGNNSVVPLVLELHARKIFKTLGYESWERYCHEEFSSIKFPRDDEGHLNRTLWYLIAGSLSRRGVGDVLHMDERNVRTLLEKAGYREELKYQVEGREEDRQPSPPRTRPGLPGNTIMSIEAKFHKLLDELDEASSELREAGHEFWTRHLGVVEGLLSQAWEKVTGDELEALLSSQEGNQE